MNERDDEQQDDVQDAFAVATIIAAIETLGSAVLTASDFAARVPNGERWRIDSYLVSAFTFASDLQMEWD